MDCECNIKIGASALRQSSQFDELFVKVHIQQKQLTQINSELQNIFKTKRTPFLTIITPKDQKYKRLPKYIMNKFTIKNEGKVAGNKIYHHGQLADQNTHLLLKKLQKVFHLLTASSTNKINLSSKFYELQEWIKRQDKEKNMKQLISKLEIIGNIKLEEATLQTFKKVINKISPQFMDSPIMATLQIFQGLDINIKADNLSSLEQKTQSDIFAGLGHSIQSDDKSLFQIISCPKDQNMTIYLSVEKLFIVEIKGSSRLIGCLISLIQ